MTTSRGLCAWRGREDVHHRRAGHCLRHQRQHIVWAVLLALGIDLITTAGGGISAPGSLRFVPVLLQSQMGSPQAFADGNCQNRGKDHRDHGIESRGRQLANDG